MRKVINYKGETFDTACYTDVDDEELEELRKQYYAKPSFEDVKKQFKTIAKGGVKNDKITKYYVRDVMTKVKHYSCRWTIEDVFNNKEILVHFKARASSNPKVFKDNVPLVDNIATAIRLAGIGVAKLPTNFPIKTVDEILTQYNVNGNYYDYSCGWGARLVGALKNKVNYYGTDPNYLLTERLNQLASDYKETVGTDTVVDIRTCGSEDFIDEWRGKMGLAFSSPPYFYLEDYKVGKQSYTDGVSYRDWLDKYLEPTFRNIHSYLIDEGYFILNINNFKDYKLVEDSIEIAKAVGFKLVAEHKLTNIKRCNVSSGFNDNSEKILVFMKGF